jgi:hypothetical protein
VAWHLHSSRERSTLDAQQWKTHCEQLESAAALEREAWALKQSDLEKQLSDKKVSMNFSEIFYMIVKQVHHTVTYM